MNDGRAPIGDAAMGPGAQREPFRPLSGGARCFNATARRAASYTTTETPQTLLVDAALAGSAFIPLFPAFRDSSDGAAYQDQLMLDGALSGNSPVLPAILEALHILTTEASRSPTPRALRGTIDALQRISVLSMGFTVQTRPIVRSIYEIPWPPFRKNKRLFQYGWSWNLLSNLHGLIATFIQGGSADQLHVAQQLLSPGNVYRFTPRSAGLNTVLGLMLSPSLFLEDVNKNVNLFLKSPEWTTLTDWVEKSWMA